MMKRLLFSMVTVLSMIASVSFAQDALARVPVFTMGEAGSQYYRIPALTQTANGTLVAIADQRGDALGDLPNIISIVAKTSTDGGKTWGDMVTIAQGNTTAGTTYGDAAVVYDEEENKIVTVFVGNENYGNSCVGLWASNSTWPLRLYKSESSDNGATWTTPVDITESIYNTIYGSSGYWIGGFFGSGSGVQLKQGDKAGRLMFVIAARKNSTWGGDCKNYAIYSDDHGATWQVSSTYACETGDEAKIVELENGDLLMSIKNRKDDKANDTGYRLMARSNDQGETWTTATVNYNLKDPACNGDVVSYEADGKYYLIHSLPASTSTRENVTVYLSLDGGQTWPISRRVYDGYSAYSTLQVLNDGTIGIIVEEGKWDDGISGEDGFNLAYYNFTLEWLMEGANVEVLEMIDKADDLLALKGIGYPSKTEKETLKAAKVSVENGATDENVAALEEAINAYYNTNDIELPQAGKTYSFISRSEVKDYYIYNNNGTLALAQYTDGAELPDAAKFFCEYDETSEKYLFKTYDTSYYLSYPSPGKTWLKDRSETGLETVAGRVSQFEISKINIDGNVNANAEDLFGFVHLWAYRGYEVKEGVSSDFMGPIVVNATDGIFDGAGGDFYKYNEINKFMSSVFTILPVEKGEAVLLDRSTWTATASSEEPKEGSAGAYASYMVDDDYATYWHSQWNGAKPTAPHWIQIDMKQSYEITKFNYVSRTAATDNCNGNVKEYKLYVSNDNISANIGTDKVPVGLTPVSEGVFTYDGSSVDHIVELPESVEGRYVYMLIEDTYNTDHNIKFGNCAEFYLWGIGEQPDVTRHEVSVSASPAMAGTATVNGKTTLNVVENSKATLKAVANSGYEFMNWTKDGEIVNYSSSIKVDVTEPAEYVANFVEIVPETEYSTVQGNSTHAERYLASFKISNGTEELFVKGVELYGKLYVNRSTHSVLNVQPGDVITFPDFEWSGVWMHAYAYIDYNNDKSFNTDANNDGLSNGELVTYNCYNAVNENGVDINGNASNAKSACGDSYTNAHGTSKGLPAFKLPENLAAGDYRLRISVAWNTFSPNGYNALAENGGILLDMTLRVGVSDKCVVTVSSGNKNGKAYIGTEDVTSVYVANDGTQTLVLTAVENEKCEFINWTLNGEIVSTDAVYTTTVITENREYLANFADKYALASEVADGLGTIVFLDEEGNEITDEYVAEGTPVKIVVTADEGYELVSLELDLEEQIEVPATSWSKDIVVADDVDVCATFSIVEETGVDNAVADVVHISATDGVILVNGYVGEIRVVNVCGQVVANVVANGKAQVNVVRGIYMVVVGEKVVKVLVK